LVYLTEKNQKDLLHTSPKRIKEPKNQCQVLIWVLRTRRPGPSWLSQDFYRNEKLLFFLLRFFFATDSA
jgi:hypothetical protein